jgi:tRNA pseudouridine38-40 synthase
LQYNGAPYLGWQKQIQGVTVQEVLERALTHVFGKDVTCFSAGRTDTGVHALGQVVHFDVESHLPKHAIYALLNRKLPKNVHVKKVSFVNSKFHARRSAHGKHYRYLIYRAEDRSPHYDDLAWVYPRPLDVEKMKAALAHFQGQHDFASFAASDTSAKTSRRHLSHVSLRATPSWIRLDFIGNGFLKQMVRIIVGTVVDVGLGRIAPEDIPGIINARDRRRAGRTAPARGLYLVKVLY